MREVKFRAWDKEQRKFVDPSYVSLFLDANHLRLHKYDPEMNTAYVTKEFNFKWPERFVLMQYTGIKDDDGVEIYEGDILLGHFTVEDVSDWKWLQLTDEEKRSGTVKLEVPDLIEFARMPLPSGIEVIGNRYENPNLLEPTHG